MSRATSARRAPRGVLLLLTLLGALGASKCPASKKTAGKPTLATATSIPDSADQVVYGMTVRLTNQSVASGLLLSDTAFIYEDGSRLELLRVNLTFFTKQGRKDGVLTSKSGTYNAKLQRLEARGDVIVIREGGRRLTSPRLIYDQLRNQVLSDTVFTLIEPARQLSGIGFETDPKLTTFRCLRACKGVAPVSVPTK